MRDPRTDAFDHIGRPARASRMWRHIQAHDWAGTPLGPMSGWSRGLTTALGLCLASRMFSAIYWGRERIVLYNDAYSEILGSKHPWALGRSADDVWSEVFDVIGPLMRRTYESGVATGADDAAIFLNRRGYVEEFYCSFSYTPLVNEFGRIEGVFTMFPETTARVIGERRLSTLQRLNAETRDARTVAEVMAAAARVCESNGCDIPFAAFYLWDEEQSRATLAAQANIGPGTALSPAVVSADDRDDRIATLVSSRGCEFPAMALDGAFAPIPTGGWRVPAERLLCVPFEPYGAETPKGFMLCGVNPYKRLDDAQLSFFRMLADQVAAATAEASSHEQEDARLRELQERARTAQHEERVRIARDLHDTLLQSIQGLRFLLEAGIDRAKAGDASAGKLFRQALDASVQAIDEGRGILSLLRSTTAPTTDLAAALAALGTMARATSGIDYKVTLQGDARELHRAVHEDVYGVGREAVTNAIHHAGAKRVLVRLDYGADFTLVVDDDGRGIEHAVLDRGRPGHFGLQGMRERAVKLGAELQFESGPGQGTQVVLCVPGTCAYTGAGRRPA